MRNRVTTVAVFAEHPRKKIQEHGKSVALTNQRSPAQNSLAQLRVVRLGAVEQLYSERTQAKADPCQYLADDTMRSSGPLRTCYQHPTQAVTWKANFEKSWARQLPL